MNSLSESKEFSAAPIRKRRVLNDYENLLSLGQIALNALIAWGVLQLLAFWKVGFIPPAYDVLSLSAVLLVWFIYRTRGVYRQSGGHLKGAIRIAKAWLVVLTILAIVGFATKTSTIFSREAIFIWSVSVFVLQVLAFSLVKFFAVRYHPRFHRIVPSVVVGTGETAQRLVTAVNSNSWMPYRIIGALKGLDTDSPEPVCGVRVQGTLKDLRAYIQAKNIKRVYLALSMRATDKIGAINLDLMDLNVDLIWIPDIASLNLLNYSVREVAGMPVIALTESPMSSSRVGMMMKRIMDIVISIIALIGLSPVLLWAAYKVKRSSPGPILFKQSRHGWDGKPFEVWKFRSMKVHTVNEGTVTQATKEDPRLTEFGRFIRRTSIDELPQLFNVLPGSMSLVRPPAACCGQ